MKYCSKILWGVLGYSTTQYPELSTFNFNLKMHIRPHLIKGFPQDIQDLLNGSLAEAKASGRDADRERAMARLRRIIRQLKEHCYTGYGPDTDPEDENKEKADDEEEENPELDLNNLPVATAVQKEIKYVTSAVDTATEEFDSMYGISPQNSVQHSDGKMY